MMNVLHFQKILLRWYDVHGRKDLPWQKQKTPYRVWISEIMLQQTQVHTVIPYYQRFIQKFPDVFSLAKANDDEVMHLWAGLGYYSRACNLQRAAKLLVEQNRGQFPDQSEALQKLPGIGESTAGAILSIAFDQAIPILDGNVKRVLARFHGISTPINEKKTEKKLWELAHQYMAKRRPAAYTQAIMDLGAMICTPKKPQCHRCPFNNHCYANKAGLVEIIPQKKPAKKLPVHERTFFIVQQGQRVLLQKRPPKGIWGNLWSLPEMPGNPEKNKIKLFCKQKLNIKVQNYVEMEAFRHTFSHYHLTLFPIFIALKKTTYQLREATEIWYDLCKKNEIGLPKPIESLLKRELLLVDFKRGTMRCRT